MRLIPHMLAEWPDRPAPRASRLPARTNVQTAQLLPESHLARIEAVPGTTLTCLTGALWITLASDSGDHLLAPGESFTAPTAGLLLAQALRTATFTLHDAETAKTVKHPNQYE